MQFISKKIRRNVTCRNKHGLSYHSPKLHVTTFHFELQ